MRRRRSSTRYRSLAAFYALPERWESGEVDLGLRWAGADGRTYRAAWIRATGELYCVEHRGEEGGGGAVRVLGCVSETALRRATAGWEEVCGKEWSFEWLCERARRHSQGRYRPPQAARPRRAVALPLREISGRLP
jgi:hypothetical protein